MLPHRFFLDQKQLTRCVHKWLLQSPKVHLRFWLRQLACLDWFPHHIICINTQVYMWKFTPWPLHSNTYFPSLLLGLELCFFYFWKKQKCSEHGKSSWEKRKLDNIQLSSNTLSVTSLVETMDIQSIRQLENTTLLYLLKYCKLVGDKPSRGAHLEKYLYIYLLLHLWLLVYMYGGQEGGN